MKIFRIMALGAILAAAAFCMADILQMEFNDFVCKNGQAKLQSTHKLIWTLIDANVAVFLLWNVPALVLTMWRYFAIAVVSEHFCLSMFLSHQGVVHLLFNMFALEKFAVGAIGLLGPAQFMALYLSGGLFSQLLSLLPDQPVHSFFVPVFQCVFYRPKAFLYVNLAFETVCLLRILPLHRFVLIDHAAHIGGLLFGMYYAHYGETCYRHLVNWLRGNVGALSTTTTSSSSMMIVNKKIWYYVHSGEVSLMTEESWVRGNVGALPTTTTSSSSMMIVNSWNKREEQGTNNCGWWTTPKQQQQNNAFTCVFVDHM